MTVTTSRSVTTRDKVRNWMFRRIHQTNLVYNACWEDPRCDRELLDIRSDSGVVMITSGGCNALAYLQDSPAAIHCVDVNYRQNALLELKRCALRTLSGNDFFQLFGKGVHPDIFWLYERELSPLLPTYAREYWDRNLRMFSEKGLRKSFYFHGSSGTFAWLTGQYIRSKKGLRQKIEQLFETADPETRQVLYNRIEERLLSGLIQWLLNRQLTMSLLGVPGAQRNLFKDDGAVDYIRRCLRHVFTQLPISENYFYRVYFYGEYTPDCCPDYLKPDFPSSIGDGLDRLHLYTTTISCFLQENPGAYSHFILLDHQDWLANHLPEALEEEWRLILANSRPGTRILLRSASPVIDFLPEFVWDSVYLETEKTVRQHQLDRVGTYAGILMAIVK